jgi:hypothetical protein
MAYPMAGEGIGTETLTANDIVLYGLPASSKKPIEPTIHRISGVRYIVVDQSANRRNNSKISKI